MDEIAHVEHETIGVPGLRLHQGEIIILHVQPSHLWTFGRYVLTLGLWAFWRRRTHFVVTNQRVVITYGIINRSERSAPLARIQNARLRRSVFSGGDVVLSTAGGSLVVDRIGPLTQSDALAFADALTPLLGHHAGL